MNKVLLVGRLTRDPELRTTPGGLAVTRFTIAVSQPYAGRNGERETNFINCTSFGRQADNISKYCRKGTLVSAEGRIRTGSYDAKDGTKRYTTEVYCDAVNFLSTKSGDGKESTESVNYASQNDYMEAPDVNVDQIDNMETADLSEDPFKSFSEEITLTNDDLPF